MLSIETQDDYKIPNENECLDIAKRVITKKERRKLKEEEKKTAFWLFHKVIGVIAGSRWKPNRKKAKSGFISSITASDVGFGVYLC